MTYTFGSPDGYRYVFFAKTTFGVHATIKKIVIHRNVQFGAKQTDGIINTFVHEGPLMGEDIFEVITNVRIFAWFVKYFCAVLINHIYRKTHDVELLITEQVIRMGKHIVTDEEVVRLYDQ